MIYNKKIIILALGAESCGRFAVYSNGEIFVSENFGDLLREENFKKYKKSVLKQIRTKKPDVILTDLHPLYLSAALGEELSKKYRIPHIKAQHHIAHIFSAIGDKLYCKKECHANSIFCHPELNNCHSKLVEGSLLNGLARNYLTASPTDESAQYNSSSILDNKDLIPDTFYGITLDGTGYGFDGNIWGGEVFKFTQIVPPDKWARGLENGQRTETFRQAQSDKIERIGSLEEQTMIGGDLAVKEPARILISILSKFLSKEKVHKNVKEYYTKNEFELLYNQFQQNFNCQTTTSTGRILDAVSVLLEFAKNERESKHGATKLLEKNSTIPYKLTPKIKNYKSRKIIDTTYLFEYLLKNISKDKKRLAATAQKYIAKGFYEIVKERLVLNENILNTKCRILNTYFAGGMANNKIMSSYLENKGIYISKKIPRGDEGIAFGQIMYYLLNF